MFAALFVIWFIGNLFLLSGGIFTSLADNVAAWVVTILALIMDLVIVYFIKLVFFVPGKRKDKDSDKIR